MNPKSDHPQVVVNPFVLLGLAVVITLILARFAPLPLLPQLPARVVGAIIFVGNLVFGLPALRGMLKARTSPDPRQPSTALVEGATYRLTRNPMYVGMLLAYAGLFIFLQTPWFVIILPILAWTLTRMVIVPEENYLQQKFGDEYMQYKSRVPRWI